MPPDRIPEAGNEDLAQRAYRVAMNHAREWYGERVRLDAGIADPDHPGFWDFAVTLKAQEEIDEAGPAGTIRVNAVSGSIAACTPLEEVQRRTLQLRGQAREPLACIISHLGRKKA